MSLARLVVAGVLLEGRTRSEVAREYRVSRRRVQKLLARFQAEGEAGLEPRRHPLGAGRGGRGGDPPCHR
ncbi:MAG: helix-turn-helix domain-containing protein [Mycobacteriales bacterium]